MLNQDYKEMLSLFIEEQVEFVLWRVKPDEKGAFSPHFYFSRKGVNSPALQGAPRILAGFAPRT